MGLGKESAVELSNPINNQHMIDGLNRVLQATCQAEHHCELVLEKSSDMNVKKVTKELSKAHDSHKTALNDAIRYLGGAPTSHLKFSSLEGVKSLFFPFRQLRREEEKLIALCDNEIRRLTGSDEVVEKLNLVKDDITACLYMTTGAKP